MKKQLAILGALAISGSAFAFVFPPLPGNDNCDVCAQDIKLLAPTIQSTTLFGSSSSANASGTESQATNNMSSNTYGVLIKAASTQTTDLSGTHVLAEASGYQSSASNNLASNIGAVGVGATQSQYVKATLSNISAKASGSGATAVQNFSSNNACLSCQ
ncbi:MAG TPA: hypothetical protein PK214_08400 [Ottowia sp.]|nr:MAG: hypothetical protein BGO36_03890 [Burkholderiales bacterium 68-10]HMT17933.1 hypothetical protein [Ottowia sp.]HMT57289.1 hypothetical protein [Ottowia sp.]HOK11947.1 hypothetical protein [Ottowia sp.]HOM20961.1 hypothetical protein [Ottowia sp.]